jgi:hypothetical protein
VRALIGSGKLEDHDKPANWLLEAKNRDFASSSRGRIQVPSCGAGHHIIKRSAFVHKEARYTCDNWEIWGYSVSVSTSDWPAPVNVLKERTLLVRFAAVKSEPGRKAASSA